MICASSLASLATFSAGGRSGFSSRLPTTIAGIAARAGVGEHLCQPRRLRFGRVLVGVARGQRAARVVDHDHAHGARRASAVERVVGARAGVDRAAGRGNVRGADARAAADPSPKGAGNARERAPNALAPPPSESPAGERREHAQAPALGEQLRVAVGLGARTPGPGPASRARRCRAARAGRPAGRREPSIAPSAAAQVAVGRDPLVGEIGARFRALGVAGDRERRQVPLLSDTGAVAALGRTLGVARRARNGRSRPSARFRAPPGRSRSRRCRDRRRRRVRSSRRRAQPDPSATEIERGDRIGLDRLVLAVAGVGGALLVLPAAGRLAQQVAVAGQRVGRDQGRRRVRDRPAAGSAAADSVKAGTTDSTARTFEPSRVGTRGDRGLVDERLFGEVPRGARAVALEHDVVPSEHRAAVRQTGDDVQLRRRPREAREQRVHFRVDLPAGAVVDEQIVLRRRPSPPNRRTRPT